MKRKFQIVVVVTLIFASIGVLISAKRVDIGKRFVSCTVDPTQQDLQLYWKNERQQPFKSIQNLKDWLGDRGQQLEFAMNGGMYKKDNSPQGLYIENQKTLHPLETANGLGNFYLKPNGVFFMTNNNVPGVCVTEDFNANDVKYATQSGPMLLINGNIHPAFTKGSTNLNVRNGLGILPNNKIVFAMSKEAVSFYDFADYFKRLGCKNALYLDGLVSRTYFPKEKWIQTDGNFGVIIGVTAKQASRAK